MTTYPALTPYLDDLEARIDEAEEQALFAQWHTFAMGGFTGDLFSPARSEPRPPSLEWPHAMVCEALDSFEAMVLQQLEPCSSLLAKGAGNPMGIRANYGTPILASLFGVEIFYMPEELDTLPTCRPLSREALRQLPDRGVPDLHQSLGGRALETGARFVELFRDYPRIARHVHIYHPDTQGPMDLCELLWGSRLFVDSYDEPELLHALLDLITQTYSAYLHEWEKIVPWRTDEVAVHWSLIHRGNLMLRDDSAMNFSPEMYRAFFMPYEQRLLKEFGGGATHYCGRGDHYIPMTTTMEGLYAINLSQPELNDLEVIFQATVDKGIQLVGFSRAYAEQALAAGRDLHGNVNVA